MLEYREFPMKTALFYLFLAPVMGYFLYVIEALAFGTLLLSLGINHVYWLGVGAGCGALSLIFVSFTLDRVRRRVPLLLAASITPAIIGLFGNLLATSNGFLIGMVEAWVISIFVCLSFFMALWVVSLNGTVVVRFRGRISGLFIFLSLLTLFIFNAIDLGLFGLVNLGLPLFEIIVLVSVAVSAGLRPWKLKQYPLAVHGNYKDYFTPTVLILTSHILWFFGTKWNIQDVFGTTNPSYVSWSQMAEIAMYEPIIIAIGALIAGILCDTRGRKTVFNASILLMGLLAIYTPALYTSGDLNAIAIVLSERFIEGFIIGTICLLIWAELGSAQLKVRRLGFVWFFFLGYSLLLFGVDHGTFGLAIPALVGQYGAQTSIVVALIALTIATNVPSIIGREVEMEDLSLDFDDKEVKATVEAFVGEDDFSSIRSQLDIIDGSPDVSDSEFDEMVGADFESMLPLRRVPGIGPKLEEKLRLAGYESAAQLAGETAIRLSEKIEGLSKPRAEKILDDARSLIKKTMGKGK
ncbi:MAG: helix-hairpin-helix domain-containing protein [Candidatus Thorarchaeota archaeon]